MLDFISNWLIRVVGCFILVLFSVLAKAQNSESEIYQDPNQPAIDSVLALIHNDTPDSTKAFYYNKIGEMSNCEDTVLKYCRLSLDYCTNADTSLIANNNYFISWAYYLTDQPTKALDYGFKSLSLYSELNNHIKIAQSNNLIADCYVEQNLCDSAFYYYDCALKMYYDIKDTVNIAYTYQLIASVYNHLNLFKSAQENVLKALQYILPTGDSAEIAYCYYNLGVIYITTSDSLYRKSIDYLKRSIFMLENSDSDDYSDIMYYAYSSLANSYIVAAKYTGLTAYADSCLFYFNRIGNFFVAQGSSNNYINSHIVYVEYLLFHKQYKESLAELLKLKEHFNNNLSSALCVDYYNYLYKIYSYLGDYKNALRNLEIRDEYKFAVLNDSTLNVLKDAEISRTRMIEELKHENQEKEHATERERMKSHRNLLICIILSILIVLVLVIRMLVIKRRANLVLHQQCSEVESVNNKLFSSIIYAQKIQNAAVPTESDVRMLFPDSFVFYRPCDIVSGDFYMAVRCGEFSVMITADCTGHGIPGAFLSMLGISALKEYMVTENDAANPSTVLDRMRSFIKSTLISQRGSLIDDGMDMTICCFNFATMRLHYAIANQTAFIIRNGSCIRLKGDKMPVGRYIRELDHFQSFEIDIQKGDMVYMFSDGIIDQLGGERQKKLLLNGLLDMLLAIAESPTDTQRNILEYKIDLWRGSIAQIDDMTVVGIRV